MINKNEVKNKMLENKESKKYNNRCLCEYTIPYKM